MPIRNIKNSFMPPNYIYDLKCRDGNAGLSSLVDETLLHVIDSDWIYYLKQTESCYYKPNAEMTSDVITSYIYDNYSERPIFDKFKFEFDNWDETTDFTMFGSILKNAIKHTLLANKDRYDKLWYTTVAEFNPLWNVDGQTITERTLTQTGTEDTERTGTDEIERDLTTTDNTDISDIKAKTGTESVAHDGDDTLTSGKTTYDSGTMYDVQQDVTERDSSDTTTFNTTDTTTIDNDRTIENTGTETTTHDTKDTLTRDLADNERIVETRQGNIGVISSVALLNEYREFSNFVFLDIVSRDIVNTICYSIY